MFIRSQNVYKFFSITGKEIQKAQPKAWSNKNGTKS